MTSRPIELKTKSMAKTKSKAILEHVGFRVADNGGYILHFSLEYPSASKNQQGWESFDEVYTTKEELAGRVIGLVTEYVDDGDGK